MTNETTARIRALNDRLRQQFEGGRIALTDGICAQEPDFVVSVLAAIQAFDDFTEPNDPFGEHDFGSVTVEGQLIFFKIDYFDPDLEMGAQDASDEATCVRVLTIMTAEEY